MNDLGTILLAYGVVLGSLGAYAAVVLRRGRRLTAGLREEEAPWT